MKRYRRNDAEIRPASSSADGLIALLYNPKREEWIGAYGAGDGLAYLGLAYPTSTSMPDDGLGLGFIDFEPMGECARIHAFPGVAEQGAGLGLCLYAGIAVLAHQELDQPCIASAATGQGYGDRSPDADAMWSRMLRARGGAPALAYRTELCASCVAADLEAFIRAGLVGWMAHPGQYEGLLLEAAEDYLPSFANADPHTRDPAVLRLIERVLLVGSSDASLVRRWRHDHGEGARLVANGRRRLVLDAADRAEVDAHRRALDFES